MNETVSIKLEVYKDNEQCFYSLPVQIEVKDKVNNVRIQLLNSTKNTEPTIPGTEPSEPGEPSNPSTEPTDPIEPVEPDPVVVEFVLIAGDSEEEISDFYISIHEVTQSEFEYIMGYNDSVFNGEDELPFGDDIQELRPVENVSWYETLVYCNKLSREYGYDYCYSINGEKNPDKWGTVPPDQNETWDAVQCDFMADGFRLPTAKEWKRAASCGLTSQDEGYTKYSGDSIITNVAWFLGNAGEKTHQVQTLKANAWGLYDMSGNVSEWVWDESGSYRIACGGSIADGDNSCSVNSQLTGSPNMRSLLRGFRVVRTNVQ